MKQHHMNIPKMTEKSSSVLNHCMQDTFARATHSATRPSARATIGYLVYKLNHSTVEFLDFSKRALGS